MRRAFRDERLARSGALEVLDRIWVWPSNQVGPRTYASVLSDPTPVSRVRDDKNEDYLGHHLRSRMQAKDA
jgi:hypothetical protein